ncbi:LrgB family protein [Bacillaceae bacterium SIJ1]|uniref:LrgB family protein n=1 Tax=Litoribacterium kuwaitense TaxID=1398745 RepID=UPI0013EBEECB|nr:LrgB family protein [Litoribacterium kuwaitense]NGP46602.1 LrgB family protein [Litoribacterium kuwaitense]
MSVVYSVFGFAGTLLIYACSKRLYVRRPSILLNPLIVTPAVLICLILFFQVPYSEFMVGGQWLSAMLGPATVAFAIPMYKSLSLLKAYAVEISVALFAGSVTAIITSFLFAVLASLGEPFVESMIPRSITTPIAMGVSEDIGGIPTMTAVYVTMTGLTGIVIGPWLLKKLRLRSDLATGLMFGMGAHGSGTARAFEESELAGAFSSLTVVVASVLTVLLTKGLYAWF